MSKGLKWHREDGRLVAPAVGAVVYREPSPSCPWVLELSGAHSRAFFNRQGDAREFAEVFYRAAREEPND